MTKMIQIRHVPDEVHRKLKAKATKQGLSLSDLLLREATRLANTPTLEDWLNGLADRPPIGLNLTSEEIVSAIHEGREERSEQIEAVLRDARERFGRA